jgi:hypothetical protein
MRDGEEGKNLEIFFPYVATATERFMKKSQTPTEKRKRKRRLKPTLMSIFGKWI